MADNYAVGPFVIGIRNLAQSLRSHYTSCRHQFVAHFLKNTLKMNNTNTLLYYISYLLILFQKLKFFARSVKL